MRIKKIKDRRRKEINLYLTFRGYLDDSICNIIKEGTRVECPIISCTHC